MTRIFTKIISKNPCNLWLKVAVLFCFCGLSFAADFSGFYRNQFSVIDVNSPQFGDINKLRLRIESDNFVGEVDWLTFHGLDSQLYGESDFGINQVYAELDFWRINATVGKQVILWGSGLFWNPTDIFNELPLFEPKVDFPGTNALKCEIATGDFSYLWFAFAPEKTADSSRFVIRNVTNFSKNDLGLSYLRNGKQNVIAADLKSQIFGAGFWLESAHFWNENKNHETYIAGFDYTINFGNGIYLGLEYLHDESGTEKSEYDWLEMFSGTRRTLGRDYIFGMLNYGWSYVFNSNVVTMMNLNDNSLIVNPSVNFSIFQDVDLMIGGYFPIGEKGAEFVPEFSDFQTFLPESMIDIIGKEMVYLWLEVNF